MNRVTLQHLIHKPDLNNRAAKPYLNTCEFCNNRLPSYQTAWRQMILNYQYSVHWFLEMRCLFKALFVLKALHFVACDFLDLLGLRKADVVKIVDDFWDRDLTAISSRELVAVPRYREPMTANYPCVCCSHWNKHKNVSFNYSLEQNVYRITLIGGRVQ